MKKLSRKERRKAEQNHKAVEQFKKGTTLFGSALAVSSIASTAALLPSTAEATDGDVGSAEITPSANDTSNTYVDNTQASTNIDTPVSDSGVEDTPTSETTVEEPVAGTEESVTSEVPTQDTSSEVEETLPQEDVALDGIAGISSFAAASATVSTSSFVSSIAGHAQSVAAANDLYASVMIAQAILESGSGASSLSQAPYYNLFGIKGSYNGQSVYMNTWEYLNGAWVVKNEPFRKYPSFTESFYDNAYVLRNTSFQSGVYYYSGAWKSNTSSYRDATAWLTGRYATDPSYGTKLNSLIEANNLTQYDTPSTGGNTGGNTGGETGGSTGGDTSGGGSTSTTDVTHTVVSGDSLWALASKYGTTIANIKSWNGLTSDTIYVGQKLIVQKGSGTSGGGSGTGAGSTGGTTSGGSSGSTTTADTYYTVKSGDSLWAISSANGVSIANLRSWNNISGDLIYPGQRLIVKKGTTSSGGSTGSGSGSAGNTGGSTGGTTSGGSTGSTASDTYYTVKSGDSLWAISSANGVSIANLRSWNSISGDLIYPGQRLIVKKGATTSGSSAGSTGATSGSASSSSSTHLVKSGDTLWGLANQYGTTIQKIKQLNNLTGDIIYIGQQLKVA